MTEKHSYEIIVLDLDGTLTNRDKVITPEGELDKPAMQRLMEASKGLSVTFHRAFDYVKSPREADRKSVV